MTSNKQQQANKANARKSTGPRSQEGKARSRLNSWKHGLSARLLVIGDEDPADFEELRASLIEQYGPQAPAEYELVEYLAGVFWRLRRLPFFEAAILAARQAQVAEDLREDEARAVAAGQDRDGEQEMSDAKWLVHVGRALIKDGVWNDALGKLARHEATLLNGLKRALQLLEENRGNSDQRPVTIQAVALRAA